MCKTTVAMITPMEELRRRNDAYINNMLQETTQHSKEHLKAAALIFAERGLADPAKQKLIKQYPALQEETFQLLQEGMSNADVKKSMLLKGISNQDVEEMIDHAESKFKKSTSFESNLYLKRTLIAVVIIAVIYNIILILRDTA